MRSFTWGALVLSLALPSAAGAQSAARPAMRFQGMDTNHDGTITREEWQGSERAFRNHDWNGDGRLSGDEVRPGARRRSDWDDRDVASSIDRDDNWTPEHFRALDHDRDGRISRDEWHAVPEMFTRIDRNRDGFLSREEFTATDDDDREDRFADLDADRDGRISRREWHGSGAVFDALDGNRDGVLTRQEAVGDGSGQEDEFRSVDVNRDGIVTPPEWHWNRAAFDRLDGNHDGRLTRQEWEQGPDAALPSQPPAYRAGYDRGRQDGVQAGHEDKPRGWDLEGQRELETADAGYQPAAGPRDQYQAGYRAGFRRGYHEGFGAAGK